MRIVSKKGANCKSKSFPRSKKKKQGSCGMSCTGGRMKLEGCTPKGSYGSNKGAEKVGFGEGL